MFKRFVKMYGNSQTRFPNLSFLKQTCGGDYKGAVLALNKLVSNAEYLRNFPVHGDVSFSRHNKYFERTGVTWEELDNLSIIHVAGTKGKGSTCALCESLLRYSGYRTGFFSSPHLIEVTERIRINGKPIAPNKFATYFWSLYDKLEKQMMDQNDFPTYFNFLTLMAILVFLDEKVDVAIIEVGIGGEYDCTNICRKVPVVGISSLGYDHVELLGTSMGSIAWNKAGIMKPGCQAFTVPQPTDAMDVLKKRSIEKKCTLNVIDMINVSKNSSKMPVEIMRANASLAVALVNSWISLCGNNIKLSEDIISTAINNCNWPGRYDIITSDNINFYIDGAHTLESIQVCAQWFMEMTKNSKNEKVLMFNVIGNRKSDSFLKILSGCGFQRVLFVPNVAERNVPDNEHNSNILERCKLHESIWLNNVSSGKTLVAYTIPEALDSLPRTSTFDVLVTGSLHLVGATLQAINYSN